MSSAPILPVALLLLLLLYFVPAIIAFSRSHRHTGAIVAANIFFGWTGLGWCVVLVWALMNQKLES